MTLKILTLIPQKLLSYVDGDNYAPWPRSRSPVNSCPPDFESGLLDHLGRFQGLRERTQMHLTQSYVWSLLN